MLKWNFLCYTLAAGFCSGFVFIQLFAVWKSCFLLYIFTFMPEIGRSFNDHAESMFTCSQSSRAMQSAIRRH